MTARIIRIVVAACAMLSATFIAAEGQSLFEKLVNPGEVIEGHAKYEKTCESCHEPFSKTSQRRLCLECHKDIATDIAQKTGFHGKRRDTAASECKTCHTDHKGRKADIVQFDSETFNHDFTDFGLSGAHQTVACSSCHAAGKKHRDAPSGCFGCHKADDKHKGALGTECASCHVTESWRKPKSFDHSKTKFPLVGAHRDVQCAVCHAGERYKALPSACIDCHKIQDVHGGRYGAKCETCHTSTKWKTISFDHAKMTKFPLNGGHRDVKCESCHTGDLYRDKLAMTCVSCHKSNDPHKGQLGTRCESCHNDASWRQKVAFDHDITAFPLIGLHAAVTCEECHRTQAYRETPQKCSACHKDTHHENKLGSDCQRCHNPNGWELWRFNHDRDTKYPLTGAHANLQCQLCHTTAAGQKVSAPTNCYACHSGDDAHRGSFGRNCENCHGTSDFRNVLRRR